MTATQDQLAALAELVGINDKTHPWLFKHLYCPFCAQWGNSRRCQSCGKDTEKARHIQSHLPALDTDAGDDVFLAPTMRWAQKQGLVPYVKGREPEHSTDFAAGLRYDITFTTNGDTGIIALIRACQAAGVPEIVAIFGRGDHDAR